MKNRLKILFIPLLLISCTHTPWIIEKQVLADFESASFPLLFVGNDNVIPAIDLEIQGEIFRLDVDTGAATATIYLEPQALDRLNVKWTGKSKFFSNLLGELQYCREYIIPTINLGSLVLHDVRGFEDKNPPPHESDGIIGLGLLGQFNVLLDFKKSEMVLYHPDIKPGYLAEEKWYEYDYSNGYSITIDNSGETHPFGLDACGGITFIDLSSRLGKSLYNYYKLTEDDGLVNEWGGRKIYFIEVEHLWLQDYDLGPEKIALMDISDLSSRAILGASFHHKHKTFFNYIKNTVWLRKY